LSEGIGCDLRKIVEILLNYYGFRPSPEEFLAIKAVNEGIHPFGVLVSIILTQNTSDRNALKALENLKARLGRSLDPRRFRGLTLEEIAGLIKPSGMHYVKARTIINILNEFSDEELDSLRTADPSSLKERLLKVKGLGPKTVDVFLLTYRGYPTFPIDTHIRRVLRRLGCVGLSDSYEVMREKVMKALPPELLLPAHIVLITHGRQVCRARHPLCSKCPLRELCPKINVR
jgi:endonuclease-3